MKRAYIHTFGCQMNDHDSLRMAEILKRDGYQISDKMDDVQLVLVNTCSVREGPENKVYSLLGRLALAKRKNKSLVIGVTGCVAQQKGEDILKKDKSVDLVCGTDCIFKLPAILKEVAEGKRIVATDWQPRQNKIQNFIPPKEIEYGQVEGCKAMIAVTKGCDNFCSFCIVPVTRGRLVSRDIQNIMREAKSLISKGAKEIQLLGQNVNSYCAGKNDFYQLLKKVADLEGLQRLRFTSPHPNDWSSSLTDLMASHSTICHQIHLPFQAGADRILSLMKRGHTIGDFMKKVEYLKKKIPDIAVSTDIIVGFPGESEQEFEETLKIMESVRFNLVYAFKYSSRPETKAASLLDDVPKKIREERLQRLLELQHKIQSGLLDHYLGSFQEVLIDSSHPKENEAMNGRTGGNIPVTVAALDLKIGDLALVEIIGRKKHSLIGKVKKSP